jgi:hypothetical protein
MTYYSHQQPAEVAGFYSDQLMTRSGWSPQSCGDVDVPSVGHGQGSQTPHGNSPGACSVREFKGQQSALCTFSRKDEAGRNIELIIDISLDGRTDQTRIDYTRFVGSKLSHSRVAEQTACPAEAGASCQGPVP